METEYYHPSEYPGVSSSDSFEKWANKEEDGTPACSQNGCELVYNFLELSEEQLKGLDSQVFIVTEDNRMIMLSRQQFSCGGSENACEVFQNFLNTDNRKLEAITYIGYSKNFLKLGIERKSINDILTSFYYFICSVGMYTKYIFSKI